jgi:hypothetical protein
MPQARGDCIQLNQNRAILPWFSHSVDTITSRNGIILKYIEIHCDQSSVNLAFPPQKPSMGSFDVFVNISKD